MYSPKTTLGPVSGATNRFNPFGMINLVPGSGAWVSVLLCQVTDDLRKAFLVNDFRLHRVTRKISTMNLEKNWINY